MLPNETITAAHGKRVSRLRARVIVDVMPQRKSSLTLDARFVTMPLCTFRSLERLPTPRHSRLGLEFGRSPGYENSTERDAGESARVLPVFVLMTGRSFWPKFVGMKLRALANVN